MVSSRAEIVFPKLKELLSPFELLEPAIRASLEDHGLELKKRDGEYHFETEYGKGFLDFHPFRVVLEVALEAPGGRELNHLRFLLTSALTKAMRQIAELTQIEWAGEKVGALEPPDLRELTVCEVVQEPHQYRVTLEGKDLSCFVVDGSWHCSLLFPSAGVEKPRWLKLTDTGRMEWAREEAQLDVPSYEISELDPDAGTMTVLIRKHGYGPGSRWLTRARPGAVLGGLGRTGYGLPPVLEGLRIDGKELLKVPDHRYGDFAICFIDSPPPLDYVLPHLLSGGIGELRGYGTADISMLALQLGAQIAGGPDLLGIGEFLKGRVAYFPAQDPVVRITHRLHDLGKFMSVEQQQEVNRNLLVQPLYGSHANLYDPKVFESLCEVAQLCRLVILDPIWAFVPFAPHELSKLYSTLQYVADRADCSILFTRSRPFSEWQNGEVFGDMLEPYGGVHWGAALVDSRGGDERGADNEEDCYLDIKRHVGSGASQPVKLKSKAGGVLINEVKGAA